MTDWSDDPDRRRPPSFEEARNRRQKVRAAGMHPDYWYAVEYDRNVPVGKVIEVKFWKRSIALFRGKDGQLRAIEDRCAHRQLKLSLGTVEGCNVVCAYHGWVFDGKGCLVECKHDLFGHKMPQMKIRDYPVQVRYGLIWIFPGNPEMSTQRHIPNIPELEGPDRWACVPVDAVWNAHHSMIIDNVNDFTHEWLHRKYQPFADAKLTKLETVGDSVRIEYDTKVGGGGFARHFIDHQTINTGHMELAYEYPYQWSNTDGQIRHWCFVLPIDERTTRAFFLFYFNRFKVPFLPLRIPRRAMDWVIRAANIFHIKPLLAQDGMAATAEQQGYERHFDEPIAELNPAVQHMQALTIRKWEEAIGKTSSIASAATTATATATATAPTAATATASDADQRA